MSAGKPGAGVWLKDKVRNALKRTAWCLDARAWANNRLFARLTPQTVRRQLIKSWSLSSLKEPSFTRCMHIQHRMKSSVVKLDGGQTVGQVLASWESKLNGYALADRLGIPRVPVLHTFSFPEECPDSWLPTNAVVKLDHGSSSREVWMLEGVAGRPDLALDKRGGRSLTPDDLFHEIRRGGGGSSAGGTVVK